MTTACRGFGVLGVVSADAFVVFVRVSIPARSGSRRNRRGRRMLDVSAVLMGRACSVRGDGSADTCHWQVFTGCVADCSGRCCAVSVPEPRNRWTDGGPVDVRLGWAVAVGCLLTVLFVVWFAFSTQAGIQERQRVEAAYAAGWAAGCDDVFQGEPLVSTVNGSTYTPDMCVRLLDRFGTPMDKVSDGSDFIVRLHGSIDAANALYESAGVLCTADGSECSDRMSAPLKVGALYDGTDPFA